MPLLKQELSRGLRLSLLLGASLLSGCAISQPVPSRPATLRADMSHAPAELARANELGQVEMVAAAALGKVVLRAFGTNGTKTPVLMTHGLESHSAWFAQSAGYMAGLGHPVYIVDRRGSGLSHARRGHCDDFRDWSRELDAAAMHVLARHRTKKLHLTGHCFGALPATVFVIEHPDMVASLILPTPAFITATDLRAGQKIHVLCDHFGRLSCSLPVPLKAEQFTEVEPYREFIRNDPLKLSQVTTAFYWQVNRARSFVRGRVEEVVCPVWMGLAGKDEIIRGAETRELFRDLGSDQKRLVIFPEAKHILEFSGEQAAFFAELQKWLQLCGD